MTGPLERRAARVLLVDADQRLLLFCMHDPERPHRGQWWITPGGGLEEDESFEQAALRELFEETGIADVTIGPMIEEHVAEWMWGDTPVLQYQRFFVVASPTTKIVSDGWEESEHRTTLSFHWWSVDEIAATRARILPEHLEELAREAVRILGR